MRLFVFILSLYITALSIVPCTDGISQTSTDADVEVSDNEHNHNHSDHKDDCTPFCVCFCCGSMIAMPYLPTLVKGKVDIFTDLLFQYKFDYSFDYSEGVWHPPAHS